MSEDPKITDTLLYGDRLCMEQRLSAAFVWDDGWLVVADQRRYFQGPALGAVAAQFVRRPIRERFQVAK